MDAYTLPPTHTHTPTLMCMRIWGGCGAGEVPPNPLAVVPEGAEQLWGMQDEAGVLGSEREQVEGKTPQGASCLVLQDGGLHPAPAHPSRNFPPG